MLLKQKFNMIIFVTALVSSGLAYFTSIWVLETELAGSINGQKDAIASSIERDIEVFDTLLMLVENQWAEELQSTLPEVARVLALENIDDPKTLKNKLTGLKTEFSLSDIHLINDQLIVYESTYEDEIGLDVGAFTDEYTRLIQGVLANKTFETHRVSLSTMTGKVKKYGYYSLPGSPFIVNGDIDVKQRLASAENNTVGEFLFGGYKDKIVSKYDLITDIDLYLLSQTDRWSFFNQGKEVEESLAKRLLEGDSAPQSDTSLMKEISIQSYDTLGFRAFLEIEYNQDILQQSKYQLRLTALSIALIVIFTTFILFHFAAKKALVDRFTDLLKQIKQAQYVHGKNISLDGNDELVELSDAINEMMSKIETEETRNRELSIIFNQDGLTNIANRRGFDERFEREWAQAIRDESVLSILMLDVDYFKEYNDLYGHVAGDNTLITIAKTIVNKLARPSDFTARYGGEEFVCLLPNTDSEGAAIISEQMRLAVQGRKIQHKQSKVSDLVTISIGCLSVKGSATIDKTTILKQVDALLYESKHNGRNRVTIESIE
jgi:diguanylate cyclase (GGDEF)-like protein